MIEFEKPNIECLAANEEENYAKFVCEPLERGYGMTIGNSLRRILLSSLPGTAITSVKIDGVVHEFSTIPGVVEDVPEIIVNLKSVRLKFDKNEEKTLQFIRHIFLQHSRFPFLTFFGFAVAEDRVDSLCLAVELGCESHTAGNGCALTERTGGHINTRDMFHIRMTLKVAVCLSEGFDIFYI